MILSCQNISKSFNGEEILKNISFHLEDRDKAALIGVNGAGKSTLLRIITGEMHPDQGIVTISHGKTLGYLAQYQNMEEDSTIYDEVKKAKQYLLDMEAQLRSLEQEMKTLPPEKQESALESYTALTHQFELENGYAVESEITGVLKGLGFEEKDFNRTLSTLSGGQKTRVVLGKLLLTRPDILLLDEPTNHLDVSSIEWLETYLMNYQGTVLIVSHDRYFLNRIVNRVIEIENGSCLSFEGNYDEYSEKKAIVRRAQYQAWAKQQAEIKHQEAVITKLKQFNREKSIRRAESREKMLDRIERIEKPQEVSADMRITLTPRRESGKDVLTVKNLSKSFDSLSLFAHQDFEIKRGERLAIIGDNGTGKSTILKILTGLVAPDEGSVDFGSKVQVGYYDQEQQLLHDEKSIFEELQDDYPTLNNTQIRNILAAFLFTDEDVFKKVGSLSGGERGRVSLAKLMLSEANFLILDEPTNHLDIISKEILEDALKAYTGTVLFVSHDRYFINQTATRILDLHQHILINYIGNYDYYLEKKDELSKKILASSSAADSGSVSNADVPLTEASVADAGKLDWQAQKEEAARKRKAENLLRRIEADIEKLESRKKEIEDEFLKPETGTDLPKCQKLSKEQQEIDAELEQLYEEWEKAAE